MNFTLRQLEYFLALCEARNFGRAAESCHVSQPALSVQIKTLEQVLGGVLVERQARDILLTPLGREVQAMAQEVLGAANRLDLLARDRRAAPRRLVLGLIPTLAPYLLPGVLAALRAGDLSLQVSVREARTERLLADLAAGRLDAAVMALPVAAPGLAAEPLFSDRFLLAGSAVRMARLDPAPPDPRRLGGAPLMLLEDGHCLTDQALEVCGLDRGGAGIDTGASSLATLSRLVAEGFGLTLMPELAARAELAAAPGLALRRFADPQPFRTVGLVRRATTPGQGWFSDLAAVIGTVGRDILRSAATAGALTTQNGPA